MSENTAAPNEPQPANNDAAGHVPQYGARLPEGNGQPASWAPAWHPESAPQPPLPRPRQATQGEDVGRGTIFALAALPLGIIVWMVIWNFGWITSLVTFGVAALAARLYITGTGGTLSRKGVWVIVSVTAVTAVLAFVGGVWLDAVSYLGGSPLAKVLDPEPWDLMAYNLATNPDFVKGYAGDFLMALLFGALGCFFTLRSLFAGTKAS